MVDPGHGGHDTGAIGPGGLREKDLVLSIARLLKPLLEERLGTQVILTRDDDRFIPRKSARPSPTSTEPISSSRFTETPAAGDEPPGGDLLPEFCQDRLGTDVATRENAASQRTVGELEDLLRQIAKGDYNTESRKLAGVVQTSLFSGIRSIAVPS